MSVRSYTPPTLVIVDVTRHVSTFVRNILHKIYISIKDSMISTYVCLCSEFSLGNCDSWLSCDSMFTCEDSDSSSGNHDSWLLFDSMFICEGSDCSSGNHDSQLLFDTVFICDESETSCTVFTILDFTAASFCLK